MKVIYLLLAAAAPLSIPSLALAQATEARATQTSSHERLIDAIASEEVRAITFEVAMREIEAFYRRDPDMAELEADCPGTISEIVAGSRGLMKEYHELESRVLKERQLSALRAALSDEYAAGAADFYSSELGQKLLISVANNYSIGESLNSATSATTTPGKNTGEIQIDREAFDRDQQKTVEDAVKGLTQAEVIQIGMQVMGKEWFPAFQKLSPTLAQINFDVSNSNLDPSIDKRLDETLNRILDDAFERCPA